MKKYYAQFAAIALVSVVSAQLIRSIGLGDAPTIVQQPESVAVEEGEPARLSVSVSGSGPMAYQWSTGFEKLPGETNAACSFDAVSPEDAGIYYCYVTNAYGWDLSEVAWLTIGELVEE